MKLARLLILLAPGLICLNLNARTYYEEDQINLNDGASSRLLERFRSGYGKIKANVKKKNYYTCDYFIRTFKKVKKGKTGFLGQTPDIPAWESFLSGWKQFKSKKCSKITGITKSRKARNLQKCIDQNKMITAAIRFCINKLKAQVKPKEPDAPAPLARMPSVAKIAPMPEPAPPPAEDMPVPPAGEPPPPAPPVPVRSVSKPASNVPDAPPAPNINLPIPPPIAPVASGPRVRAPADQTPAPALKKNPNRGLLDDIKAGKQLKETKSTNPKGLPPSDPLEAAVEKCKKDKNAMYGGLNCDGVNNLLARRNAVEDEDEDEDQKFNDDDD